jgi:hypothetical protein
MPDRTVVFYECQDIENRDPFDRVAAVSGINNLSDKDWRVPHYSGDGELAVIVDQVGDGRTTSHLRFLRIRPDAPFILSAARELSPVEVEQDERISEFTHLVIFPDGFMGAITSRDAPQHKWLGYYFQQACDQDTHIVNLYRSDVVQRLKQLKKGGLSAVSVKVRTSEIEQIANDEQAKGFKQILNAGKGTAAVTIGVQLSVGRHNTHLSDGIAAEAVHLGENADMLEQMIVRGKDEDGVRDTINMKAERVAWGVEIEAAAEDGVYYSAIRRARREAQQATGALNQAARGS